MVSLQCLGDELSPSPASRAKDSDAHAVSLTRVSLRFFCSLRRQQCRHRRRQPGTRRTSELLFGAVLIGLNEFPDQTRALFVVQTEHPEFDEFVRDDSAGPDGADDLARRVFLEINLPAGLEFEVIDVDSARELALDSNRRDLLLVGDAHRVFLARALGGFSRQDSDVGEGQMTEHQRHHRTEPRTIEPFQTPYHFSLRSELRGVAAIGIFSHCAEPGSTTAKTTAPIVTAPPVARALTAAACDDGFPARTRTRA